MSGRLSLVFTSCLGGFLIGASLMSMFYQQNALILREARWAPNGDMLLWFYHRDDVMIIPKPKFVRD